LSLDLRGRGVSKEFLAGINCDLFDHFTAGVSRRYCEKATPGCRRNLRDITFSGRLAESMDFDRAACVERMFVQGIVCSAHYISSHLQPRLRHAYELMDRVFPGSESVYLRRYSRPLETRRTESAQARAVIAAERALRSC